MALIEHFIVVAENFPVNSSASLTEGMLVKLNSSGEVVLATGVADEIAIGIVGDTKSTSTSGLPTTNNAYVGVGGNSTAFVNRISDQFDETKSSGKATVYMNGGTFSTNMYDTSVTFAVGDQLYVNAAGKVSNVGVSSGSEQIVGVCVKTPAAYDSGVPGLDVNGSLTLGNYLKLKLTI